MKFSEFKPEEPFVRRFIDVYQLYETKEPVLLKAIPNGKVEAWILGDGDLFYQVGESPEFIKAKKSSFYPATSNITTFYLEPPFRCINIKFKLTLLGLNFFHHQMAHLIELSYSSFLSSQVFESIQDMIETNYILCATDLDKLMKRAFLSYDYDKKIEIPLKVIKCASSSMSISEISDQLGLSTKTLERLALKYFDLTPKQLLKIVRFNNAIKDIRESENPRIGDALGSGYFDQSHFVKECRNITSMPPRELLSKLNLPVHDLHYI